MSQPDPHHHRQHNSKPEPTSKLIYYPLLGLGFVFLIGWFYLMRQFNFMEWLAQFGPETHKGSFNMLAIMLWMIPALLLWKYYLRWLNQRFQIGGLHDQERHDAMYQDPPQSNANNTDNPPADDSQEHR